MNIKSQHTPKSSKLNHDRETMKYVLLVVTGFPNSRLIIIHQIPNMSYIGHSHV